MQKYFSITNLIIVLILFCSENAFSQSYNEYKKFAIVKFKEGNYRKAFELMTNAAGACKTSDANEILVWKQLISKCYTDFTKAEELYDQGNLDKAAPLYKKVLMKNPTDSVCNWRLVEFSGLNFSGSVKPLHAFDITAEVENQKLNNQNVYKLSTCFTLSKNDFIKKQNYPIYYLITDPNGFIISKYENIFELHGFEANYTEKHMINYKSANEKVCLSYTINEEVIVQGKYRLDLYMDGHQIGRASFLITEN